ncbi:MAG: hypothetical protein IJ381_01190 [Clostridia bacterium]|nr:hypothetical protein [Clostridia bacterium]
MMKASVSLSASRFGAPLKMQPADQIPDAEPIYHAGDTVMHPGEGVCTIKQLRSMEFSGTQKRLYYVLKPATEKSSSTIYLPVFRGNTVLRRLLSRDDILALIRKSKEHAGLWITDSKQRKEAFTRILSDGDYVKMIRMIHEIHTENEQRIREGKRPCAADEAIRAEAERLLHQEFSCVLHLSLDDTISFIVSELEKD